MKTPRHSTSPVLTQDIQHYPAYYTPKPLIVAKPPNPKAHFSAKYRCPTNSKSIRRKTHRPAAHPLSGHEPFEPPPQVDGHRRHVRHCLHEKVPFTESGRIARQLPRMEHLPSGPGSRL